MKFVVIMSDTACIEIRASVEIEADSFEHAVALISQGDPTDIEWEEHDGWYERSGDPRYEKG